MGDKELKRLMTDVAKGEITMKEAEKKIDPEEVQEEETQKRSTKSKGRLK